MGDSLTREIPKKKESQAYEPSKALIIHTIRCADMKGGNYSNGQPGKRVDQQVVNQI